MGAQSGARPRRWTDFVTQAALACISQMRRLCKPGALLPVGLKDAFYRVVLQFNYAPPSAPEDLDDILRETRVPEALPRPSRRARGALNENMGDEQLCALLRDARADLTSGQAPRVRAAWRNRVRALDLARPRRTLPSPRHSPASPSTSRVT